MAVDAGVLTHQMPMCNASTQATPAVSANVTLVGAAVKGGLYVTEDSDLVEAGFTYSVAATAAAVWKLQLCRDTQIGNAVDIVGLPLVNPTTGVVTAASALCTAPAAVTAVGTTVKKNYNFRLAKGDIVLFTVTVGAAGSGIGFFYAKTYPRGETSLSTKLQGVTVVSTLLSTT